MGPFFSASHAHHPGPSFTERIVVVAVSRGKGCFLSLGQSKNLFGYRLATYSDILG